MLNTKTYGEYTDKIAIRVLELNQVKLATEEDCQWGLDYWAKLFKTTTWEGLRMLAKKNENMQAVSESIYMLNQDEWLQEQCIRREEYENFMRRREEKMQNLENESKIVKPDLIDKDAKLNEKDVENKALGRRNKTIKSGIVKIK